MPVGYFLTGLAADAADITVFAAASLTDSLKQIAAAYEKNSDDKIIFNFAASSTLARQIEEGAPADIFFSADEAKMNALAKKGLIDTATRKSRLGNVLVVVIPNDSALEIKSAADLTNSAIKKIALADTKAVPAGVYAKAWLEKQQSFGPRSNRESFPRKMCAARSQRSNPAMWKRASSIRRMPAFPRKLKSPTPSRQQMRRKSLTRWRS